MLAIKRKEKQSFVIMLNGKTVKVTALRCGRGSVSIGISADPDVHIVRSELLTSGNSKEVK